MVCYYTRYHSESTILWISPFVNSKDGVDFAMLLALRAPRLRSVGKAGELQILCCQGFEVNDYNFTLDALALKPSGFCNVRVNLMKLLCGKG